MTIQKTPHDPADGPIVGTVVKQLAGADAADFLSKLETLHAGSALSLPSLMPGLTGKRVTAMLTGLTEKSPTRRQWHFDLTWCDTFIGNATAEQDGDTIGLW